MNVRAIFLIVGVAGAVAAWWALSPDPDSELQADGGSPAAAVSAAAPEARAARGGAGLSGDTPEAVIIQDSMGLSLDASRLFQLGFGGGLVIDSETRESIDAVINALPPEPGPQDLERLERTLRAGLPREEAEKAFKLVTGYRAYSADVMREMMPLGIPKNREEAKAFFDQMDLVKRRHFDGNTANALFSTEDRNARLVMEAGFVQQDESLTPEQKKQALDGLRAQLPADKRDAILPIEPAASQPAS